MDRDVVAAAQRRLAALAAQHAGRQEVTDTPEDVEPDGTGVPINPPTQSSSVPRAEQARHIAAQGAQHGRWGISAPHVTVAALAVVVLVVSVAWWSLRSVPQAEPVRLSSHGVGPSIRQAPPTAAVSAAVPASTAAPAGQVASGGTSRLVVDVAGKVRHPGIVELPAGSRVVDALAAAGGAKPGVSLTSLNLARLLVDGEQIVVGIAVPVVGGAAPIAGGSSAAATTQSVAPVNLNSATAEQLDTLPGVGPVTAQAILSWRTDNGPFTSVDELLEVSGIGDATLSDLRPYVYV